MNDYQVLAVKGRSFLWDSILSVIGYYYDELFLVKIDALDS